MPPKFGRTRLSQVDKRVEYLGVSRELPEDDLPTLRRSLQFILLLREQALLREEEPDMAMITKEAYHRIASLYFKANAKFSQPVIMCETSWGWAVPSSGHAWTCLALIILFGYGLKKFWVKKNFRSKRNLGQKKFWVKKIFLVYKKFWSKKMFGPKILVWKKFCSKKNVGSEKKWSESNFLLRKNLPSKKFCVWNFFLSWNTFCLNFFIVQQNFGCKKIVSPKTIFGGKFFFDPKKFCVQKKFWVQKKFGSKKVFGSKKKNWCQKKFWSKKILGQKSFGSKKILGSKKFGYKTFWV